MILPYSYCVRESQDLRKILSLNIRNARTSLNLSQMKLAEYANISVSHMLDIEYCKTWVSDKTLNNIARALNMEAYELLTPERTEEEPKGKDFYMKQMVKLVRGKKSQLQKKIGEEMDDLIMEIRKQKSENQH